MVAVVQLVRASDCGSGCRGFESHQPPLKEVYRRMFAYFFFYSREIYKTLIDYAHK